MRATHLRQVRATAAILLAAFVPLTASACNVLVGVTDVTFAMDASDGPSEGSEASESSPPPSDTGSDVKEGGSHKDAASEADAPANDASADADALLDSPREAG